MRCSGKVVGSVVLALVSLAGCATREGAGIPTGAAIVPTENALILPPPGGPAVLSVVERRSANAVEQDVYLHTSASTPGQNFLRIEMYGPMSAVPDQKGSTYRLVRTSEMMREARNAIPGVGLVQSPYFLQNNYGPFGYAFGHGRNGDACLYAWQQIRPPQSQRSPLQAYGTIQIRLRHCATGATESELLEPVYGYTISGTFADPSWNPYGSPLAMDAGIGRTGNPIYPKEQPVPVSPRDERTPAQARVETERPKPAAQQKAPPQEKPVPAPGVHGAVGVPQPTDAAKPASSVIVPLPACVEQVGEDCP